MVTLPTSNATNNTISLFCRSVSISNVEALQQQQQQIQQQQFTIIDQIENNLLHHKVIDLRLCMEWIWDVNEIASYCVPICLEWKSETLQQIRYPIVKNEFVSSHALILYFEEEENGEATCLVTNPKRNSCNLLLNHLKLEFAFL